MPADSRPDYMILMGLNPPYALEDIQAAYREKAKQTHPDRGGSVADFEKLQAAYEQATEHLTFREDRRAWIAKEMEHFLAIQSLRTSLEKFGAQVTTGSATWKERSFGDFAQLTENITAVTLHQSPHGPEVLVLLGEQAALLTQLQRLELTDSEIEDDVIQLLGRLSYLQTLDLSGNPITSNIEVAIGKLKNLRELKLKRTSVGCFSHWRMQRYVKRQARQMPVLPTR
jgi:hypothetical protein